MQRDPFVTLPSTSWSHVRQLLGQSAPSIRDKLHFDHTLKKSQGPQLGEEWRVEYSTAEWRACYSPWINTTPLHLWCATQHLRWQREGELMWCPWPFFSHPSSRSILLLLTNTQLDEGLQGQSTAAGCVLWETFPLNNHAHYKDTTRNLWLTVNSRQKHTLMPKQTRARVSAEWTRLTT